MVKGRTVVSCAALTLPLMNLTSCEAPDQDRVPKTEISRDLEWEHVAYAEYAISPQDFTDRTGRRWHLVGPAKIAEGVVPDDDISETPEQTAQNAQRRAAFLALPRPERKAALADKMTAVGLIGKPGHYFEYRSEPDEEMIENLVDRLDEPAPEVPAIPPVEQAPTSQGGLKAQVFPDGIDNRVRVDPQSWWPLHATGKTYTTQRNNGSMYVMGHHTGATAAHCVFKAGLGWTPPAVALGADLNASNQRIWPQGYYYPGYWVPNAWISNSSDWDWDFALLEFGSDRVGDWYGAFGLRTPSDGEFGYRNMGGYPGEKPEPTEWFNVYYGSVAVFSGGTRFYTFNDATQGQSGTCIFDGDYFCLGHFSTYSVSGNWNAARRHTQTTYNFYVAYGNGWPSN